MPRYSVTGTLTPDCATADTGDVAGVFNGAGYWQWTVGETIWFLWFWDGSFSYYISTSLGNLPGAYWFNLVPGVVGEFYNAGGGSGIATISEIAVPGYVVFEVSDGDNAGKLIATEW